MLSITLETQAKRTFLVSNTSWATGIRLLTNSPFSGGRSVNSRTSCLIFLSTLALRLSSLIGVTRGFRSDPWRLLGSSTYSASSEELVENRTLILSTVLLKKFSVMTSRCSISLWMDFDSIAPVGIKSDYIEREDSIHGKLKASLG